MTQNPDRINPLDPDQNGPVETPAPAVPAESPVLAEHPELADTIFADNDEDLETSWATTETALATEAGEDAREQAAANPAVIELMESIVPGSSAELTGEAVEPDEA